MHADMHLSGITLLDSAEEILVERPKQNSVVDQLWNKLQACNFRRIFSSLIHYYEYQLKV